MRRALLALCLVPSLGFAYELRRDSTGEIVRWGKVVEFVMNENLAQQINEQAAFMAIDAAKTNMGDASPGLTMNLRSGPTEGVGYNFDDADRNQNDIVIPEDWPYEDNAIAVTVVTVDTRKHEIIDADIAFNAANRKFKVIEEAEVDQPGAVHDDIQNTITHELGHALGLAHNSAMPDVVMYPSARRGEIKKRFIHTDDAQGLAFLYPEGAQNQVSEAPSGAGCSSMPASPIGLLVLLLMPLTRRSRAARRQASLLATSFVVLTMSTANASPMERSEMPALDAEIIGTAQVVSTKSIRLTGSKLLFTDVEMLVRECLKGKCLKTYIIRVPGGRWQHYEQYVEGLSVPREGDVVGFAMPFTNARGLKAPRVYSLSSARDFSAFALGVQKSGLKLKSAPLSVEKQNTR